MTQPQAPGLGRVPSPDDDRDRQYPFSRVMAKPAELPSYHYWYPGGILDQGPSPACVGFSGAHLRHFSPVRVPATNNTGHALYRACKEIDGIPDVDGTYVRALAKVLKRDGDISMYVWAPNMDELREWVLTRGPVIVGTVWTSDMFSPDSNGFVEPTGAEAGGHAYIIRGHNRGERKWRMSNSWGPGWGQSGHFWMTNDSLEYVLFGHRWPGEALAAVELE